MRARGSRLEHLLRPRKKVAPVPHGVPDWAPKSQLLLPGEHQILTSSLPTSILLQRDYYHLCH